MQNSMILDHSISLSDDESSVDFPPQPSSSTSLCSSLSHQSSYMECDFMIPNSIMLDTNEQQDDDHSSAINFQNIEVLNYRR